MYRERALFPLLRFFLTLLILSYGTAFVACGPEPSGSDGQTTETVAKTSTEFVTDKSSEAASSETSDNEPSPSDNQEAHGADATEKTSESVVEKAPIDCTLSCGNIRAKCVDKNTVSTCEAQAGCAVWKTAPCGGGKECKDGKCIVQTCNGPGECGKGFHCEKGKCESNASCCKEGTKECKSDATRVCEKGTDNCGKWSASTACKKGEGCSKNQCTVCRHRKCSGPLDCCKGTSCSFGYCLVHCDKSKGDLNNPDCASKEFCFPLQAGGQTMCLPDTTEPKGAACSIIKMCQGGLSCVPLGGGFKCYTDCKPGATNNKCTAQETCIRVGNAPRGGVCAPAKKRHEVCNLTNPCVAKHLCTGEAGSPTHCLQECNPQGNPTGCPPTDLCAGYPNSGPNKGICVQRCNNPGTKDNCSYGQCRSKQNQKICL